MNETEKTIFMFLLFLAGGLIIVSMVAGPVEADIAALATAASSIIISGGLILYALRFWRKKKP